MAGLEWRLAVWGSRQPKERWQKRCRRQGEKQTTGRISPYQHFQVARQPFLHKSSLQCRSLARDKVDTTLQPHQRALFLHLCLVKSVRPLISDVDFWHLPYSGCFKNRLLEKPYLLCSWRLLRIWSKIQHSAVLNTALRLFMHEGLQAEFKTAVWIFNHKCFWFPEMYVCLYCHNIIKWLCMSAKGYW